METNPATRYEITNFDMEDLIIIFGRELMQSGLTVKIKDKPGVAIIVYQQIESSTVIPKP